MQVEWDTCKSVLVLVLLSPHLNFTTTDESIPRLLKFSDLEAAGG